MAWKYYTKKSIGQEIYNLGSLLLVITLLLVKLQNFFELEFHVLSNEVKVCQYLYRIGYVSSQSSFQDLGIYFSTYQECWLLLAHKMAFS